MPFNTTRAIPAGWSEHHQGTVESAHNAAVVITDPTRSTPGVFDATTGTYGAPTPHYVAGGPADTNPAWRAGVPCRIQRLREDTATMHGGQHVTTRLYLLQLPAGLPDVKVGYVATVSSCANDTNFVGESLTASDVQHGSERFSRDIVWAHDQAPERA